MSDPTAEQIVTDFIHAIERKDLDAALALAAADIVYDNVPMNAVTGVEATRATLESFVTSSDEIEWVIHHQVAVGDVVMNERTDRFRTGANWVEIPVAGVWEVRGGRITLWRDYFDLQGLMTQMSAAAE
jgi:limonene-1,2-epoxide hydrolase